MAFTIDPRLEKGRIRCGFYTSETGNDFGAFRIFTVQGRELLIIASSGDKDLGIDWEHVSVSLSNRCPTWGEMCFVKSLFWSAEDTVMQLHPPSSRWINNHPYCLHLWRPKNLEIPMPPEIAVGFRKDQQ